MQVFLKVGKTAPPPALVGLLELCRGGIGDGGRSLGYNWKVLSVYLLKEGRLPVG